MKDKSNLTLIGGKQIIISENEVDELEAIRDALYVFLDKILPDAYATPETISNDFFEVLLDTFPTPESPAPEMPTHDEVHAILATNHMYNGWAYTTDEGLKRLKNGLLYSKIKHLAKLEKVSTGYGHVKYKVVDNPFGLSEDHLALIADKGNLCFGYRTDGSLIVIHTD